MSDHLTPFEVAKRQIGPQSKIEQILGYKRTAGYVWQRAAKGRAAGDFSSVMQLRNLMEYCAAERIVMHLNWLVFGATEDEIRAAEASAAAMFAAHARVADLRRVEAAE